MFYLHRLPMDSCTVFYGRVVALLEELTQYYDREGRMVTQEDCNPDVSCVAGMRDGPGILIVTKEGQVEYMNRRSWGFIRAINESSSRSSRGLLPVEVTDLCRQILKSCHQRNIPLPRPSGGPSLRHRKSADDAIEHPEDPDIDQSEIRHLAGGAHHPVLLRGLKLPGQEDSASPRALILMEGVARREVATLLAKERFQLTEREHSVVQGLAKGWTNKEIAAELHIAEPTVKAHIRSIMDKTKCSTRTGIVAQIFHA